MTNSSKSGIKAQVFLYWRLW